MMMMMMRYAKQLMPGTEQMGQTVDVLPEINDASQKEPKRRYGSKEPKAATSKRRQKDSVEKQDTGAKKAKSKAAPAKKLRPA